jgi:hypothetical protein
MGKIGYDPDIAKQLTDAGFMELVKRMARVYTLTDEQWNGLGSNSTTGTNQDTNAEYFKAKAGRNCSVEVKKDRRIEYLFHFGIDSNTTCLAS